MGLSLSTIGKFFRVFRMKDTKVVMVGLDAAGKTTALYKLQLGEVMTTIPTIGFNVEKIQYKNIRMTVWDIGGQDRLRPLWTHYYEAAHAVIFIVDSSDRTRIAQARDELHKLLDDQRLPASARLLVFANKQDLPDAMSSAELMAELQLKGTQRPFWVQPCVALRGEGMYEGLDWLAANIVTS